MSNKSASELIAGMVVDLWFLSTDNIICIATLGMVNWMLEKSNIKIFSVTKILPTPVNRWGNLLGGA